jgi:hypothetical protein
LEKAGETIEIARQTALIEYFFIIELVMLRVKSLEAIQ